MAAAEKGYDDMTPIKVIVPLVLAGFAAGVTFAALSAEAPAAYYEEMTGAVCVPDNPGVSGYGYPAGESQGAQALNTASSAQLFFCPVPYTEDITPDTISTIDLYVHDANDTGTGNSYKVRAWACSFPPNGTGTSCSVGDSTTGAGYKTITLSGSELDDLADDEVPYLYVMLPGSDWSSASPNTYTGQSGILGIRFYRSS